MSTDSTPQFPKSSEIVGFIKQYEKLIGLALLLVVGWFGYGKLVNYWENHDQRVYDKEKAALQVLVDQNKVIATANAKMASEYKALSERVLAQNAKLSQSIIDRDAATVNQQAVVRTLPPDALAARWQTLVNLPALSVQPVAGGTFSVTAVAAVETVVMLEDVPRLEGNLKDSQAQTANLTEQVTKADGVIGGLNKQVDGLNAQIVGEQKICRAEVDLVKSKARKSKRSWFVRGVIAGGGIALAIFKYSR